MKNRNVHFSSLTDKWNTPKSVYDQLNQEFNFDYDPCPANYMEETLFDKPKINEVSTNGLHVEWGKSTYCNPPYSQIADWVKKGFYEAKKGKTIVFLIPSRTDTRWWHEYVMQAKEIRFIKGRLKFGDAVNSAPFPSAIVVFSHLLKTDNQENSEEV